MDTRKIKEQLGYHNVVLMEKALEITVRWYMDNPLPSGGEMEQNLADPLRLRIGRLAYSDIQGSLRGNEE